MAAASSCERRLQITSVCLKPATREGVNQGSGLSGRLGGGAGEGRDEGVGLDWVHASVVSLVPSEKT